MCVPKVPLCFYDKLKYKIRNKVLVFISILKLGYKSMNRFKFYFQIN